MSVRSKSVWRIAVLSLALYGSAMAQTSTLVFEGGAGKLAYGTYANRGQTNSVNIIPDYSTAGYKGGGVPIPFVPAAVTVTAPSGGDDTALIQNAINTVAVMPLGTNGFRGAVLVKAGNYLVNSTINITSNGIVIRGEGNQAAGGTKITMTAAVQDNLFDARGGGGPTEVGGTRVSITDSFVSSGTNAFNVSDASGYNVGDDIQIVYKMNTNWLVDIGTYSIEPTDFDDTDGDGYTNESWQASDYQLTFERKITAINGNTITINAPLVQPIESKYGGADIFKYTFSGQMTNVGFESLRLESTYTSDTDELHGWIAIKISDARDSWVRQVTARYFGYSCVSLGSTCHYITVEDCAQLDPKSITTGGRKYSFDINGSTYVLMQRCYTRGGRHDYVSGSKVPGPNVFVDSVAESAFADAGPHHRYSTGQLYDNIKSDYHINVQNRRNSGSGHGWAGAQILFWNCIASSMVCDAPAGAMSWSIGCIAPEGSVYYPPDEPDGIWQSQNTHITSPRSLYYRQLQDRLGRDAVRNVILPPQETGTVWTALSSWAGEGLFGSNVVAWVDNESIMTPTNFVSVEGVVRNLQMLDRGVTSAWSKISGPGTATFGDASALATTVSFSEGGTYSLRVTVEDGLTAASADVTTFYDDGAVDVAVSGATGAGAGFATLNAMLNKGGPADIYFFWDTSDQGTNINAWAHTNILVSQANGSSSVNVTGLTVAATYYYRCFASNAVSTAWSGVTNFFVANGSFPSSKDSIVGEAQAAAPAPDYYVDASNALSGSMGSTLSTNRENRVLVLGYTLPVLGPGQTLANATLSFEITKARDHQGINPALNVYLLNTADPSGSGTNFFYYGPSNSTADAKFVGSTYLDVGTGDVTYADDEQDHSYELTGEALAMLQGFYGGDHIPEQSEVFFRFNLDKTWDYLSGTPYQRYYIDLADDESMLLISAATPVPPVTVAFNANGGSSAVPATKQVTPGAAYGELAATSRSGHTLRGWFTAASGGSMINVATTVTNTSDHTLYAQWTTATSVFVSARHYIRGESETNTLVLDYYQTSSATIGTGGATGSRDDRNAVFGFSLPTLPAGATLESGTFNFEITAARDSTGGQNLPQLHAYLLNTSDPTSSGTAFFYHGLSDPSPNVELIGTTSVTIASGVTTQIVFSAGQEMRSFTLTGDALTLLKSYYDGNTPLQSNAYFRFNMSVDPLITTFRRYLVNTLADGSSLELIYTAPPLTAYESWLVQYYGDAGYDDTQLASNGIHTIRETYIAGLDPTDPAVRFKIADLLMPTGDRVLQWDGVTGRLYNVSWSSNLTGGSGFEMIGSNISWNSAAFTDTVHQAELNGFYRIEVKLEE